MRSVAPGRHQVVTEDFAAALMPRVSRQRVNPQAKSCHDFRMPEADLAIGGLWLRSAIEPWALFRPKPLGRKIGAANPHPKLGNNGPRGGWRYQGESLGKKRTAEQ